MILDSTERARLALRVPSLVREACYIGGQWVSGKGSIPVYNPATGKIIASVPDLDAEAATLAVGAAANSIAAWKAMSGKERSAILRAWFDLIVAHTDDLARIMTAEQGKPLAEARGEIAYAASYVEWFAEEAKRVYGDVIPGHLRDKRFVVTRQPVGVVAAITPWNFPAAMITRKVGPALAVGCTVVLKPSELTPLSALALADLGERAGIPAGVFNVVTGDARAIGEVFTGDPRVRKLSFTGSTPVGKMLAAQCMGTVKRVSLELGGNAPFIVFDDADIDKAVEGAIASKFRNTGQTCVCANRLLVQAGVYDAFAEKFAKKVGAMVVGDGLEGETHQGPLINDAAVDKVRRHVNDALDRGGRVLTGGPALDNATGQFYPPTVIADVPSDALAATEETFGPLAVLIRFHSEAEAIAIANDTRAGLAAYVYTRDQSRGWRVSEALDYGMVGLNTGLFSSEMAPFGGMKESGFGREGSYLGLQDYLEIKSICVEVASAGQV